MTHSVDVTAESLYEAAVLALKAFRARDWSDGPGSATRLEVAARALAVSHSLSVSQVEGWLHSAGKSPKEQVLKTRLREILPENAS